jgi:hypothetical protein
MLTTAHLLLLQAPAAGGAYSDTLTPASLPIVGGTLTTRHAFHDTLTAASLPITGGTLTGVHGHHATLTAASLPIAGGTLTLTFVGGAYSDTLSAAALPITGGSLTTSFRLNTYSDSLTAASLPIVGGTLVGTLVSAASTDGQTVLTKGPAGKAFTRKRYERVLAQLAAERAKVEKAQEEAKEALQEARSLPPADPQVQRAIETARKAQEALLEYRELQAQLDQSYEAYEAQQALDEEHVLALILKEEDKIKKLIAAQMARIVSRRYH